MDSGEALQLASIVRAAKHPGFSALRLHPIIVGQLKTVVQVCDELKAVFDKHLEFAGLETYLEHEGKDIEPIGPIELGDTGGVIYVVGSLPKQKKKPNADYIAAEALLQMGEDLDCPWVPQARQALQEKTARQTTMVFPIV